MKALSPANKRRLQAVYWSFIVCWACNAYGLIVTWFQEKQLLAQMQNGHPYVADFVLNYIAGQLAMESVHHHINVYDPVLQQQHIDAVIAPIKQELVFYAQYPPSFFLFNTPLAIMDPHMAWIFWCLLGLIMMAGSLYLLTRNSGKFVLAGSLVDTVSSFPAWLCFRLGQFALAVFPAMACFFWSLEKKRYFIAGLITGLLTVKLQYLPILGLVGLVLGRWPYFGGALLSVSLVVLASGLLLGWQTIRDYPHTLLTAESNKAFSGVSSEHMQNLRGLLVQLTGADSGTVHAIAWAGFIAAALYIAYIWARPYKLVQTHPFAFRAYAALTIILMLLFSPHTHNQDYLLITIPCVWLWQMAEADLPNPKSAPALKVFLLAACPVSWLLFFISQVPICHFPPFAIAATVIGCYLSFKIIPSLAKFSSKAPSEPDV